MSQSLSAVCYLKNLVVVLIIALMSFLFALLSTDQPVLHLVLLSINRRSTIVDGRWSMVGWIESLWQEYPADHMRR